MSFHSIFPFVNRIAGEIVNDCLPFVYPYLVDETVAVRGKVDTVCPGFQGNGIRVEKSDDMTA